MIESNKLVKVTNRNKGTTGYVIPDMGNLRRRFSVNETKQITFEELQKLSWVPGGKYLLKHCLFIDDEEVVKELVGKVEPEYYYSKQDVTKLLKNGSLDQLKDCLDYAPDGVKEIVKQVAVETEIPDIKKREAIQESTGLNITNVIENSKDPEAKEEVFKPQGRRAAPVAAQTTSQRRTSPYIKK